MHTAPARIALVGDFDPDIVAHQGIERSFALAAQAGAMPVEPVWIGTARLVVGDESRLRTTKGIWCVPGSPYQHAEGALWAIRYARTHSVPFLGTCGGFQHALLEYVRNVLGQTQAGHAEDDPDTAFPLLQRLGCPLVGATGRIRLTGEGQLPGIYGAGAGTEEFNCSFGLNPEYERLFSNGPMRIVARSDDGQVRVVELTPHRFFFGTLFQPERRALRGELHPLVAAFFRAALT